MSKTSIRVEPPVTAAGIGAARFKTDQLGPQTAAYGSIAAGLAIHYNTTAGTIVQPLPTTGQVGDEIELYLDTSDGTNTLSATFGGSTVATLRVAGHMAMVRFNGTTWLDAGPGKKTLASEDARYSIGLRPKMFGAVADGTTNDAAAFAALFAAAASQGVDVVIPAANYKLNSGFTYDSDTHSVRCLGQVVLDFTGMTTGYAIWVTGRGSRSTTLNGRSTAHSFGGMEILGPDVDSTTVDCFYFNDTSNLSQVNMDKLQIFGFRDQVYYDTNAWCIRWFGSTFGHAHRRLHAFYCGTNAGENISFYGCTLYSSTNASGTATAVYVDVAGQIDLYFFGTSFDYNDVEIAQNSGIVNLIGCHLEDRGNNSNPMIRLSYTGGYSHTTLSIIGGTIAPTETTPGRDHLIECVSGNAIRVISDGVKYNTYGLAMDVVKVLSSSPSVTFVGGDIDSTTAPTMARPGDVCNILQNAGWEAGAKTGWNNGGTFAFNVQTTNVATGTYSLQITGTGQVGTSFIRQAVQCGAFTDLFVSADITAVGMAGGEVDFQVAWVGADFATISTSVVSVITANQANTRSGAKLQAPAGTAFAQVTFFPNTLNGNVYVDNVYAAMLKPSGGGIFPQFGTSVNTFAQGNDSRITGAAQKASNLSDLASATAALTNLGAGRAPDVQVFTTSGTWTKPANATTCEVLAIGPGAGGGSGRRGAATTIRCGGGGGGAGAAEKEIFSASSLTATVAISIGTGGAGGSAVTVDSTDGNAGSAGTGSTTFGSYLSAARGAPGGGGTSSTGTAGNAGDTATSTTGAAASVSGLAGNASSGSAIGSTGGGSGGGITSADATSAGGAGVGPLRIPSSTISGGTADGGSGSAGVNSVAPNGGGGGAGGGSAKTVAAGAGGNGGNYGAGGGGGGASLNGFSSGAGGSGASGLVVVVSR